MGLSGPLIYIYIFFLVSFQVLGQAGECLAGCHLVLVPAGVPRKPGQDGSGNLETLRL